MPKKAVIFDFNRTLYDPEQGALYSGVPEMLEELQNERRLFLFSKLEGGRKDLLRELGIDRYFQNTYFVDRKTPECILEILGENDLDSDACMIVGDLITSELAAGREAGLETIWLRQGKFAGTVGDFEPTHTVTSVSDLSDLLKRLS